MVPQVPWPGLAGGSIAASSLARDRCVSVTCMIRPCAHSRMSSGRRGISTRLWTVGGTASVTEGVPHIRCLPPFLVMASCAGRSWLPTPAGPQPFVLPVESGVTVLIGGHS